MNKEASLGGTVRDRRLALGYSLGQLANKVNKTAASIRAWERGDTVPTDDETVALSDALDLDGDLLLSLRKASIAAAPMPVEPADIEAADVDVDDPWEPEDAAAADGDEAAEVDESDGPEPAKRDESPEIEDGDAEPAAAALVAADDEEPLEEGPVEDHIDIDSATQGGEALVDTVAALTAAEFADEAEDTVVDASADARGPEMDGSSPDPAIVGSTAKPALHEAMTEAVPVVPAGAVAVATDAMPDLRAVTAEPHTAPGSSNPVVQAWDNVVDTYHRVFDPRRKWIYRVRWVLLLIAFFFMLRILAWAGGELWDAIGEVLDGIAFTPSETPDVSN